MKCTFKILNLLAWIWISFMGLPTSLAANCTTGYYEDNGQCLPCHESCETCENDTGWLTWDEMVLNSTTGLWERCPDGQYFDTPRQMCQDWDGSCYDKCAYQTHCFQCAIDKVLDLSSIQCVDSCSSNQILIENVQFQNLKVCRDNEYYVNPDSTEIVELGTKKYPYK